jgi:hypothetical protein
MKLPLHDLLMELHSAMAIWFVIVGLGVFGSACLSVPTARRRIRQHRGRVRERSDRLAAEAEKLRRYAEEVSAAAARAQETAQRRQAEWKELSRAIDAAWQAYLDADTAASRIACAAAFPVPEGRLTPAELHQRKRYLHQSTAEAYRRGDLSVTEMTEVLCHRNGWSPYRHPADHEVALRRIARQRRRDAYLVIAEFEREARRAAEIALVTTHALQAEALAATVRAQHVRYHRPHRRAVAVPARNGIQLRVRAGLVVGATRR